MQGRNSQNEPSPKHVVLSPAGTILEPPVISGCSHIYTALAFNTQDISQVLEQNSLILKAIHELHATGHAEGVVALQEMLQKNLLFLCSAADAAASQPPSESAAAASSNNPHPHTFQSTS